ncbi:DivIVA domain-containing protein [Bifidobacterium panos]|uniref:DivIVA domain repeat protein n=1 Tax=Bifidobacterium panos TaxID=2675321 RepID=A0ABX1SVI3_9BIFI|nr:DivIVA domain-containing protein [Bifidobacterium sp. DSM 109963]NMN01846.1 DivIVA domain repeat protein [Bifidobacterium sp. DSM 109963]
MAQQSEASIPRVGKRKWGYDAEQVDEFLDHAHALYDSDNVQLTQRDIQKASFKLTRGGYDIAQVDAALMRLERAVVDKQTTWEISQHGRVAWKAQTEDLYRQIARHASRTERERFGEGKKGEPSYDRKQVDKLTDDIVSKCAAELGLEGAEVGNARDLDKITAAHVANIVFTQRNGKKGYSERQVDYFLGACIQLLSRLESYERLTGYVAADDADTAAAEPVAAPAPAETGVTPLFSQGMQAHPRADESIETPHSFAPGGDAQSFEALSQAEQSLFTPKAPAVQREVQVAPVEQPEQQPERYAKLEQYARPVKSVESELPVQSVQSVQSDLPMQHVRSVQPERYAQSEQSAQPVQFAQSVQPVQPVQPMQPVQPAQPEKSAPASFAPTSKPEERPASASASLASLADMVEATSQEMPAIDIPSLPQMPNLDAPNPFVSSSLPPSFVPTGQENADGATYDPASSAADDEKKEQ